jgi:RNA polymerase sigma-70 factor (ECF subfamily)
MSFLTLHEEKAALVTPVDILTSHYQDNFDKLCKVYARRMGTKEDGEDVVQEAYLRAFRYINSYDPTFDFQGWFYRILQNAHRHHRRFMNGQTVEINEEELEPLGCNRYNEQLLSAVKKELSSMKDNNAEIVYLYFFHGYRLADIQKVTDENYKTIDQCIQRFKQRIIIKYGKLFE